MNKKTLATILVLGLAAVGGTAFAGAKSVSDVYLGNGFFQGAFGSVRNSTSTSSWLRCEAYANSSSSSSFMCDAYDGNQYRSCWGNSNSLANVVIGLDSDDRVYVQYSGSTCTYIAVTKASINEPKKP